MSVLQDVTCLPTPSCTGKKSTALNASAMSASRLFDGHIASTCGLHSNPLAASSAVGSGSRGIPAVDPSPAMRHRADPLIINY